MQKNMHFRISETPERNLGQNQDGDMALGDHLLTPIYCNLDGHTQEGHWRALTGSSLTK